MSAARLLRLTSAACASTTAALGAVGLFGWAWGIDPLVRVSPGLVPIVPITAFALVILGLSILTFEAGYRGPWASRAWRSLTLVPLAVGAVALIERTVGGPTWVGRLLFAERLATTPGSAEGRPALATALALFLIASALLLARRGRLRRMVATAALAVAGATAGIALNAYSLVPAAEVYRVGLFADMALHTALGLLLATLGALTAGGPRGLTGLLTRDSAGGRVARRVLPALLLMPAVTSGLVHAGSGAGIYSVELERSLSVVAVTIAMALVFWPAALRIDRADRGRATAERLSLTDPLSGLANRRGLEMRLATAQAEAEATGEPYAVVALDADGLKRVNDTLGHDAGDEVIRGIADALESALRPLDTAARVGGDEFIVLLPGVGEHEAGGTARRISAEVNLRLRDPRYGGASISAGFAGWSAGLGWSAVMATADRLLYDAKRTRKATGPTASRPG